MKANITVTIKTVQHSNPQQAVDVLARVVVKEILAKEIAK